MTDNTKPPDRPVGLRGKRLGPYEILSPIGAGGMGEVYRARDSKLDRDVAIKVLPAHLSASPEALARFEREAKAVAALSHPNILAIHDFGTQDGVTYAVTELLEGETLRSKLDGGPISQKQTVDYGLQIAKGLSAAHERGVVHRDLKPENLFVSKDDHVKILDFGLAKREGKVAPGEETSAPTVSGHTEPGTVMGTVGYMSPEQVRGLPVDHRSDIFSFGAILYELLSGKRAFRKDTPADTMSAILREEPQNLSESGRSVPAALDHIVRHCLEKDRDRRFQSARDIEFALSEASDPTVTSGKQPAAPPTPKKKAMISAAVLVGLAAAGVLLMNRAPKIDAPGIKRIAVLPFENLGAPEDDYFTDGMADAVRGKLTSLPGIEVIARDSSNLYKKTEKGPQQIAQELDAGYLLKATVRWQKSGGSSRVQVSPELVEVKESGAPASRWQAPFDASLTDVFQVQADIATRVAQALGVALGSKDEHRLAATPTQNLAAYEAFLRGEEIFWNWSMGFLTPERALSFYEQAVALDPGFGQAWAMVARASSLSYANSPTADGGKRAREAAERAMALAPEAPAAHLALSDYQDGVRNDAKRALEHAETARRLAPGSADILLSVALLESALGRQEQAFVHLKQAQHLDPRSAHIARCLAGELITLRRYDEARRDVDVALALAPADIRNIEVKAMTFLGEGDLTGARAVLDGVPKEVDPTVLVAQFAIYLDLIWVLNEEQLDLLLRLTANAFPDRESWAIKLAQGYALKGDPAKMRNFAQQARTASEERLREHPNRHSSHAILGLALAYLGRKEDAIREAERAVALAPQDAYNRHQLARVYILVGEPEKAIDQLEPLLKIPYVLSPGWLKIDPNFDPLRGNPRFEKLVAAK